MKASNYLSIASLALFIGGGFLTSCTNEIEPALYPNAPGSTLLRAPEIYAWSGNHTFGAGSRSEVIEEYYEVMPDFIEWCNEFWPSVVPTTSPAIPADAVEVTLNNYYNYLDGGDFEFEEGGTYVLKGDVAELNDRTVGILLSKVPNNVKIYVDGAWNLFDSYQGEGLEIYICNTCKNKSYFDTWDQENLYLENVKIYNYGSCEILDTKNSIGEGTVIYNVGEFRVEQNYEGDNTDLSLDPLNITQTIYSIGEFTFGGGVYINTDDSYFKKVCVDGQMTVAEGKTVHTGYLNADELYGHDGSKVEMAPEGMIVAGTISMKKSATVAPVSDHGFILTNNIIGIENTNNDAEGNVMESEVDAVNFPTIFQNVDIYVTRTINNSQDLETIKSYKAENGTTYPLNTDEFDASEDDTFKNDVNEFGCGIGYKYVKKVTPDPEETDPKEPTDDPVVGPNIPELNTDFTEVEINLSLNDSHSNYTQEDLVSKLSIHVRYAGDVEVFIPVPQGYYCDADDFAIRDIPLQPETTSYEIAGKTVTLTVEFEEGGIRVTTDGIDQDVLDYCYKTFGDGVNFEIYNYYGLYEQAEDGSWVRKEDGNIAREKILEYLNDATVEFLDNPAPDYYINAFKANEAGKGDHDCTVSIVDEQRSDYGDPETGSHLNGSDLNQIYTKNGVDHDHSHDAK